jgi:hypothetical protein
MLKIISPKIGIGYGLFVIGLIEKNPFLTAYDVQQTAIAFQ